MALVKKWNCYLLETMEQRQNLSWNWTKIGQTGRVQSLSRSNCRKCFSIYLCTRVEDLSIPGKPTWRLKKCWNIQKISLSLNVKNFWSVWMDFIPRMNQSYLFILFMIIILVTQVIKSFNLKHKNEIKSFKLKISIKFSGFGLCPHCQSVIPLCGENCFLTNATKICPRNIVDHFDHHKLWFNISLPVFLGPDLYQREHLRMS